MYPAPHDLTDLRLAPLTLALDSRLAEMARLDLPELTHRVALDSDRPDRTRAERERALLMSVTRSLELHGWTLDWDERGLRLSRHRHAVVLGVPATFTQFLTGG